MSATRSSFVAVCPTAPESKSLPASRQELEPPTAGPERDVLGRYRDLAGRPREIVTRHGAGGSVLVIDRDRRTLSDRRLVAHLGADEPATNAALLCRLYLADPRGCRPRLVTMADLEVIPPGEVVGGHAGDEGDRARDQEEPHRLLVDALGFTHRIELVTASAMTIPELRWLRHPPEGHAGPGALVSVRDVIGRLECYEPARAMTTRAVRRHRTDPTISVAVLRAELERVAASRIVLNRQLRQTVLEALAREGLSMSQIAVRCGRVKRDARGNISGETSWLARRLGLLPEGGEAAPTPWIHSDVLALIARRGLGLCPREVELA